MTAKPDPVDRLKYVAAIVKSRLDYVADQLGQVDAEYPLTEDDTEAMQSMLAEVQRTAIEAAATYCREGSDLDTYADGRPVRTRLETEQGVIFEYRWHPQPDHPNNQPHEIYTAKGRDGRRRTVIVSAPGVLDSVEHTGRGLRAVK